MNLIKESMLYIENHLEEDINLSVISNKMGYSEYYLSKMFKKEMHMTVMEYVRKRKLVKASEAILNGDKIIDVAIKFGWETHAGFTKAFINEFGFSPSLLKAMIIQIESLGGSNMKHVFLKNKDVHSSKETLLQCLKEELILGNIVFDENELNEVYQKACTAYSGVKRYSGDEYITHTLNVSILLAEMNADIEVIYAGMFCDAWRKSKMTTEELVKTIPYNVGSIIQKLSKADDKYDLANQDEDVILIKLAERLHNMRTVEFLDESKRMEKAKETLEIILPVAKKMGDSKILTELNDLAMKYLCK